MRKNLRSDSPADDTARRWTEAERLVEYGEITLSDFIEVLAEPSGDGDQPGDRGRP